MAGVEEEEKLQEQMQKKTGEKGWLRLGSCEEVNRNCEEAAEEVKIGEGT